MKKLIAYIVGISLIVGTGYHLYKISKEGELKVVGLSRKTTPTPQPTYEPTYIIHNEDGSIDFKLDINYLMERNPQTEPATIIVHNEGNTITFKRK